MRWRAGAVAAAVLCGMCFSTSPSSASNDDFSDAILLKGYSGSDTSQAGRVYGSAEPGEPAHAGRGPFRSLWWKYRPDVNGWLSLDTHGSLINTVLGLYTGAAVDRLTEVTSNDDDGSALGASGLFEIPVLGNVMYKIAAASFLRGPGYGYGYGRGYRMNWRFLPGRGRLVHRSFAAKDGWVVETTENGGRGGALATSGPLRVGDDARDRQYRAILSFDTALVPEKAVILSARLKLRRQTLVGRNPLATHGALLVDVGRPLFGASSLLQLDDFAASAGLSRAGRVGKLPVNGFYVADLTKSALAAINRRGATQLRLRFERDDNDDRGADYLDFFGGEAVTLHRPVLEIRYTSP